MVGERYWFAATDHHLNRLGSFGGPGRSQKAKKPPPSTCKPKRLHFDELGPADGSLRPASCKPTAAGPGELRAACRAYSASWNTGRNCVSFRYLHARRKIDWSRPGSLRGFFCLLAVQPAKGRSRHCAKKAGSQPAIGRWLVKLCSGPWSPGRLAAARPLLLAQHLRIPLWSKPTRGSQGTVTMPSNAAPVQWPGVFQMASGET